MSKFVAKYLTAGDTAASLTVKLTTVAGTALDLTNALSVTLVMIDQISNREITGPVTVTDATNGVVRYDFQEDDLADPGVYDLVFDVEYAEGILTYPTNGPLTIQVLNNLDAELDSIDPVITPAAVYRFTASKVTVRDIIKAQIQTSIYLDLDVTDEVVMSYVSDADLRRINQGIAHWAVYLNRDELGQSSNSIISGITWNVPEGLSSVRQGDVAITFDGSKTSGLNPPAVVNTIFSKLSWHNRKTIKPKSMFEDIPPIWTEETVFNNPVVRSSDVPDYLLWEEI